MSWTSLKWRSNRFMNRKLAVSPSHHNCLSDNCCSAIFLSYCLGFLFSYFFSPLCTDGGLSNLFMHEFSCSFYFYVFVFDNELKSRTNAVAFFIKYIEYTYHCTGKLIHL